MNEQQVSSASTRPSPGTRGTGSSSSSGASLKVKKNIDKFRTLVRRHSDGDSARNLMQSFDNAAEQPVDIDEDEELVADEHMQRPEDAASPGTKLWASLERDPATAARRLHLRQCGDRLASGWKLEVVVRFNSAEILVKEVPVLRMGADGSVAITEHWPGVMPGARWATAHLPHRL